jgi:hypothetical protein
MCRTPKRKKKDKNVRAVEMQEESTEQEPFNYFVGSIGMRDSDSDVCINYLNESSNQMNSQSINVNIQKQNQILHNVSVNDVNVFVNDVNVSDTVSDVNAIDVKNDVNSVNAVGSEAYDKSMFIAPLLVNQEKLIPFKLDTGAANVNLITLSDFKLLSSKPKLSQSNAGLCAVNNTKIDHVGRCRLSITVNGTLQHCMFFVVPTGQTLIGDKDCVRLGLVKRVSAVNCSDKIDRISMFVKQKYPKLFSGTGCLEGEHKITLKPDAVPVIQPMRRVPKSRMEPLKKLLDKQVQAGYIIQVNEPTAWVNQFVMAEKKDGTFRLCIDPKDLNEAIMREHFPIPRKDDILADLTEGKVFSKLDASSGFHQVQLDNDSSLLTTFNTPFGRYRYRRLPMGISSASEVFHKKLEQIVQGLEGVRVYIDDIITWGSNEQEHDRRLLALLQRLSDANLVLNFQKCEFKVKQLTYLGEVISDSGCSPDPAKIQAIRDMPVPRDKHDVQRLLGMVNFLNRFIPNLSSHTRHMRSLLQKDTIWNWAHEHQKEWESLKEFIAKDCNLAFFDSSKPIKLSNDASKGGLGCCLLIFTDGCWKPVAYASRGMTRCERNYAQIEKELLAVVFACERFHNYIYGLDVCVETDHQPLISVFKKTLYDTPARLQRLRLRLQKYNLKFEFTPGKFLAIADTLSRAYPKCKDDSYISELDHDVAIHVCSVRADISVSEEKWNLFAQETQTDVELRTIMEVLNSGEGALPRPYASFADELQIINGVILKGRRLVVPKSLRQEMLDRIHEGHLGREKCKRRAREHVYWPGINDAVDSMIERCSTCQSMRFAQPRQPLMPHAKGLSPYEKVGCDLFYFHQQTYLIVTDYYSHYPEIALLGNESSSQVVLKMKSIFARWGIPATVVSDNGPQFSSSTFKKFADQWEFTHVTSSPYYPRSNGLAENSVKVVKRLLEKALQDGQDPYLSLLAYRDTPLECGRSPAELLMGRQLRTKLPSVRIQVTDTDPDKALQNRPSDSSVVRYNKGTKPLKPLHSGQIVRVRNNGSPGWSQKAQVVESDGARSYRVQTENGTMMRRNRQDLLLTPEPFNSPTVSLPHQPILSSGSDVQNTPVSHNEQTQSTVVETDSYVPENVRTSSRVRKKPSRLIEEC